LPLRHPIADEGKPVGTHSKSRGKLWVFRTRRIGEAHGIVMHNGIFRLQCVTHDVASALVGGEVIVITTERGLANAGFLRPIAPVGNAVPCAEAHHGAEMVAVTSPVCRVMASAMRNKSARPVRRNEYQSQVSVPSSELSQAIPPRS